MAEVTKSVGECVHTASFFNATFAQVRNWNQLKSKLLFRLAFKLGKKIFAIRVDGDTFLSYNCTNALALINVKN